MATSIDQAFIKQFEAEVFTAYQRMGSKLRPTVRSKNNIVGATTVFQKVGKGVASTKSRHGNVPVMNVDHTAIEVTLQDYYAGDWVDKLDELKTNIDERGVNNVLADATSGATHYHAYSVTASWAKGRTPATVIGHHIFYRITD